MTAGQRVPRRYDYVDLLRGFAALSVLICHYQWFFVTGIGAGWRTDVEMPLDPILWPFYRHGGIAVELFWVLSGFVFAVAYGQQGRDISIRTFVVHRVARLYPLHLATLLFIAMVQAVGLRANGEWQVYPGNDLPHFLLHLGFASNWFTMASSFNGPIWSVSVEVLVYGLFLAYLRRAGQNLAAAAMLVLASFALARVTNSQVAVCSTLFFVGVGIAIVAPWAAGRLGRWTLPAALLGIGLFVLACVAVAAAGHGDKLPTLLIFAGTPAILCLFVALDLGARPLHQRWHWIGAITYAVYLLHMPVLILVRTILGGPLEQPGIASLGAFLALVIGLALVTHRHFEMPFQKLIRARFRSPASIAPDGLPGEGQQQGR
jgi:peptidoglycan/LPS O-acetylase OafA/YrhL